MYAAIGVWNMEAGNWDEQQRALHEEIVPLVRQSPGFVSGYWMADRVAGKSYTTIVFEDEEAAQRFREFVLGPERGKRQEEAGVGNESFIIAEVLAEARR
jgi:hypothetical protein